MCTPHRFPLSQPTPVSVMIEPARDGGFVVVERPREAGYFAGLLYAGDLTGCLAYVRKHFTPPKPVKAQPAK